MMKFTKLSNNIQDALYDFCLEQESMNGYVSDEEIDILLESAFAVFDRLHGTSLPVVPVYRYHMYAGEQFTDEILPISIKENGSLYDRIVHLGTFMLDSYSDDNDKVMAVERGYDVVYDLDSGEIKLLYRIMTKDGSVTTLYRVDTDLFEDFDVHEFIIDISSQIIGKLRQSLSVPAKNVKEAV